MGNVTKTCIIRIGKSQVVQIPKTWMEHLNWGEEVEMVIQAGQLIIRSARRPRQGWEEKFRVMHKLGKDQHTEDSPSTEWDKREWEWK